MIVSNTLKIVEVDGKILTFAIPPGQRKYSRRMFESATLGDTEPEAITTTVVADTQPPIGVDIKPGAAQGPPGPETSGHEASKNSERGEGALIDEETAKNGNPPDSRKTEEANPALEEKVDENDMAEPVNPECQGAEATNKSPENENPGKTAADGSNANGTSSQTDGGHSSAPAVSEEDVLHSISMLTQLENKIVDVDGRFNSKDIATHNTWRSFRGMRNNQDLGTLFEMREEFYVYKHPQIVKEAKKGR